jgi:hypothetical protein
MLAAPARVNSVKSQPERASRPLSSRFSSWLICTLVACGWRATSDLIPAAAWANRWGEVLDCINCRRESFNLRARKRVEILPWSNHGLLTDSAAQAVGTSMYESSRSRQKFQIWSLLLDARLGCFSVLATRLVPRTTASTPLCPFGRLSVCGRAARRVGAFFVRTMGNVLHVDFERAKANCHFTCVLHFFKSSSLYHTNRDSL